jgi:hypothetical protein
MYSHRLAVRVLCVVVLLAAMRSTADAQAADKATSKTVSGIFTDMSDKWIKVKTDGEDEAVKYLYDGANKKLPAAHIFPVSRVQVTYKSDGDNRQLVSVRKLATRPAGTVMGEVLGVYNDFWVEVKPKNGPPDGYALNFPPEKYKSVVDTLKSLKKGDTVILQFTSDNERHRVQALKKVNK